MNDLVVGLYTSNLYFSAPDRVSKIFFSRVRSCPWKASFAARRFYLCESGCRKLPALPCLDARIRKASFALPSDVSIALQRVVTISHNPARSTRPHRET
jgi:hypothetical protein